MRGIHGKETINLHKFLCFFLFVASDLFHRKSCKELSRITTMLVHLVRKIDQKLEAEKIS
uniref:Uncharacterized protein n=1 Tax=Cucumis melo TaxID=3656 RepID=A0A9I9EBQ0_CUCME